MGHGHLLTDRRKALMHLKPQAGDLLRQASLESFGSQLMIQAEHLNQPF